MVNERAGHGRSPMSRLADAPAWSRSRCQWGLDQSADRTACSASSKCAVTGAGVRGEPIRGAVLDQAAPFDHQHALEIARLCDVVGDAEQSRVAPELPGPAEQPAALGPVEAAERLVEDDEARPGRIERPTEPDALPFAPGEPAAALAQAGLEPVGEMRQDTQQLGLGRALSPSRGLGVRVARRRGGSRAGSDSRAGPPGRARPSRRAADRAAPRRAARHRRGPARPRPGASPAGARRGSISPPPRARRSPRGSPARSGPRSTRGSSGRPRGRPRTRTRWPRPAGARSVRRTTPG